jgi:aspartate/methionine/tyrosine aminotransferase
MQKNIFDDLLPSASMAITQIAEEMKRNGKVVYSLSIGDTHFSPPGKIKERLSNAINLGKTHYTEAKGNVELRNIVAKYYDNQYKPEEVIICPGLKEALYILLVSMNINRVCVLEPAWLGYQSSCVLAGKEYVSINTYEHNWLDRLEEAQFDLLLLCTPNNPDGNVFDKETLDRIHEIIEKKKSYLVIDEIYRIYNYFQNNYNPMEVFYKYEKTIIANGLSKSHAMTGLRIGFLLAKDKKLMDKMIIVQQNLSTCANSVGQFGSIGFIDALPEVEKYKEYYKKNKDLVLQIIPQLKSFEPKGGFYYFFDLKIFNICDAQAFCIELLKNQGIALVPGGAYGKGFDSWVRLSFSIDTAILEEALIKLKNYLKV